MTTTKNDIIELPVALMQILTPEQAWHYKIVPKSVTEEAITFYVGQGERGEGLVDELELLFGKDIQFEQTTDKKIRETLGRYYRKQQSTGKDTKQAADIDSDDFLLELIKEAHRIDSSDIHIESYQERCRVRMRIDGMLVERYALKQTDYPGLINKIKIMANLDIAEKRLPQDGRIFYEKGDLKFDIRVSILPTLHGEKAVLRLLSKDATDIDIDALGFSEFDKQNYLEGARQQNGIILISGPTGSGKTTTLYATLRLLNDKTRNILTIEDPVEYTLEGINQVQLKERIGLTFTSALRTFLRQDPDIIMLGEIRDGQTASMAVRASLTGHLVLSTIHTNSAWGTISRLNDMGVPPFLIANTINTTVAQRLVRLLCPHCKKKEKFNKKLYPRNFTPTTKLKRHYVATGCEACFYTGYKGRKAIFEVIPIDEVLAKRIKENQLDVREILEQRNIKTLTENAFTLFREGQTSLEEVYPILLKSN